jgi:hypothetical protein
LRPHAIVETRPGCRSIPAASRPPLLGEVLTVGVQTTQVGGWRADVVITDASGTGCAAAARAAAHGPPLVALDAPQPGRFRTRRQIAERVDAGDILGEVGSAIVAAPSSGVLTGPSARGARIASGQRIAEIDPCGDPQRCFGIAADAAAIARRVCAAVGSDARSNAPGRPHSSYSGRGFPPTPPEPRSVHTRAHRGLRRNRMKSFELPLPLLGAVVGTRALLGAGIGLLVAGTLTPAERRTIGWTLVAIGGLSTIPLAIGVFSRRRDIA